MLELVRQCPRMGRLYIVLEATAQGVLITSPVAETMLELERLSV